MCEAISKEPIKWKPKMKLKCHNCHINSKMIVKKYSPVDKHDDTNFIVKCPKCGDESCVTEDLFREMQEEAINIKGKQE